MTDVTAGQTAAGRDTGDIELWLDEFFEAYYAARPVNATFIGVHRHDHRLPDLRDDGAGDTIATMHDLLERCPLRPPSPGSTESSDGPAVTAGNLPWHLEVDLRLARGFLRTQLWEWTSPHFRRGNPCVFTGEAVFGVMSLFLTDWAPFAERAEAAASRLAAIPAFLDSARRTIDCAPVAWTERAIHECRGALAFLDHGLRTLIETDIRHSDGSGAPRDRPPGATAPSDFLPRLTAAGEAAATAFTAFATWLDTELRHRPLAGVACGEEVLDLYITEGHFLETGAVDIERYAREQLQEAVSDLAAHASDFGAASSAEALRGLTRIHPPAAQYYERYARILAQTRSLAGARDLLTWPDFPIRFVPRPEWARQAAPDLYFLFYRSPAAFARPPVHDHLVIPIDASMPVEEQERLLQATNDSVIRLNHVIHHGGIGHHVQNWHAFRSLSRVGRIAAVDCASRIAMFCGGTMAEGWACYATDLMAEHGALLPLEQYAEVQSRARMSARAVVDVRLHQGRFTLADAARFYENHAGMSATAAQAEAVKNSMFPGAALMYLAGSDRIRTLRSEIAAIERDRFSLRRFHDTFLSFGSIPVSLVARQMLEDARTANAAGLSSGHGSDSVRHVE
jgi:Bacterial protein of unknown function (DUF885)